MYSNSCQGIIAKDDLTYCEQCHAPLHKSCANHCLECGKTLCDTCFAENNFKCEEWEVNSSCIANVSHSNSGFAFSNHNNANALGSAFLGRVDSNKNVETHLTLSIITGRGVKKYSVVFKGTKVNGSDSSKQ